MSVPPVSSTSSMLPSPHQHEESGRSIKEILSNAGRKATRGGVAGMGAMAFNVVCFMPFRTTMNYQYKHRGTLLDTVKILRQQGPTRFYAGFPFAIVQGPFAKFGDVAANDLALTLMNSYESTERLPDFLKTPVGSVSAGLFRIVITPVDSCKTIYQVYGKGARSMLTMKVHKNGIFSLWHGAGGNATATMIGHYPWFTARHYLQKAVPEKPELTGYNAIRDFSIGAAAGAISNLLTNPIRAIKTTRQASSNPESYAKIFYKFMRTEGFIRGWTRGLGVKTLATMVQDGFFNTGIGIIRDLWDKKHPM